MYLSIIIVNYRSAELIRACLLSIKQGGQLAAGQYEILVVDNASGDGCEQMLSNEFPEARWVQMGYNSGFARANNEGIRRSNGEVVLLLNPDTLVVDHAIGECLNRLMHSDYIGAGVQLLNEDKSPQISGNYFMTGGLNHLMVLPYTGRAIRWLGNQLKVRKTNVPEAQGTVEVDWINGAFLMVKKTAIEKAGLLDEDFFLYAEEIEWCSRLLKTGKMCIYGDLHVVHLQGESAGNAFGSAAKGYTTLTGKMGLQLMLSGFVRIRKQFGAGWFLFHLAAYVFTIPVLFIITIFRTILLRPGVGKEWRAWSGFSKNVFKVVANAFRIVRNKPHFYKVL